MRQDRYGLGSLDQLDPTRSDLQDLDLKDLNPAITNETIKQPLLNTAETQEVLRCTISVFCYGAGLFLMAWGKMINHSLLVFLFGLALLGAGSTLFLVPLNRTPANGHKPQDYDRIMNNLQQPTTVKTPGLARNDAQPNIDTANHRIPSSFTEMMIYFKM
ncbi:MAG: hypothetical protein CMF50_08690 [Legionellales bacterium]|nr:hypothetical protein [Legionellales bacterium]|tara:strand:+ start:14197 stop:14676 length:480 start_codon:yes stop_codon:yes gene_type:complete